MHAMSYAEMHN